MRLIWNIPAPEEIFPSGAFLQQFAARRDFVTRAKHAAPIEPSKRSMDSCFGP